MREPLGGRQETMKRKRLQHAADTLCQMFCGWRLINCYRDLVNLGSGVLTIDALAGTCEFNGRPIPQLSIAFELHAWLQQDLAAHRIPSEAIRQAFLVADLGFSPIEASQRVTPDQHFDHGGRTVRAGPFHRLRIRCESTVETNDASYRSSYEDLEEWPVGWPAA